MLPLMNMLPPPPVKSSDKPGTKMVFKNLPEHAQEKIIHYLQLGDFPRAKELYDYFLSQQES